MESSSEDASPGVGTLLINWALEYDTQKIVHIKNKTIGLLNRIIQVAIIAYIIGYVYFMVDVDQGMVSYCFPTSDDANSNPHPNPINESRSTLPERDLLVQHSNQH